MRSFDLLCAIARPKPDLERALELLRGGVDWPELVGLAAKHAVRPHLIQALRDLGWTTMPPETKAALEAFQLFHLTRVLSLSEELGRVADALARSGLPFASFKGIALATLHHGSRPLREFDDIDLIVPKPRLAEAEGVLRSLGYRGADGEAAFRNAFFAYQRQYAFVRTEPDVSVDLHWAFTSASLPFPLDPAEIWADLQPVSIGGRAIPTLAGANLALLLAGHGTKERWKRLGWVCDFATCLDRNRDLDWPAIFQRAHRRGCGNAVLFACAMAEALLDVAVPPALAPLVQRNDRVAALTRSTSRALRESLPAAAGPRDLADLDLCDAWSRKAGVILGMAFTRTEGDYEAMKLPPPLWRLYHLTRPFRLAAKTLSGVRG